MPVDRGRLLAQPIRYPGHHLVASRSAQRRGKVSAIRSPGLGGGARENLGLARSKLEVEDLAPLTVDPRLGEGRDREPIGELELADGARLCARPDQERGAASPTTATPAATAASFTKRISGTYFASQLPKRGLGQLGQPRDICRRRPPK
jgi:hypothetical protein